LADTRLNIEDFGGGCRTEIFEAATNDQDSVIIEPNCGVLSPCNEEITENTPAVRCTFIEFNRWS